MKIHHRQAIVQKVRLDVEVYLSNLFEKSGLTYGEIFRILSQVMDNYARYLVRQERHPDDPDKKGDEA